MAAERRFNEALHALVDALDETAAPSMIIGGVAVIASGVPRQTVDIDATILGRAAPLETVVDIFARHGITPRIPERVRNLIREIGMALDHPNRIDAFDAIVRRVRQARP